MATSVFDLSVPERMQLVEDIWDSIAAEADRMPVPDAQQAELERRLSQYEADPSIGVPWDVVRTRLAARL